MKTQNVLMFALAFCAMVICQGTPALSQTEPTVTVQPLMITPANVVTGQSVNFTVSISISNPSNFALASNGITGQCTATGFDPFSLTFSGGVTEVNPGLFLGTSGSESLEAGNPGTVTVTCTVTAQFVGTGPATGTNSGTFSVVSCTGTPVTSSGDTANNANFTNETFMLSIDVSVANTQTPKSPVSTGLTGNSGIFSCNGGELKTESESPSATPGDPMSMNDTVSIFWTVAQWNYVPSGSCSSCSFNSNGSTMVTSQNTPEEVAVTATCTQ